MHNDGGSDSSDSSYDSNSAKIACMNQNDYKRKRTEHEKREDRIESELCIIAILLIFLVFLIIFYFF